MRYISTYSKEEDARYISIRSRLDKLHTSQLERILDAAEKNDLCLDEFNYDKSTGKFCPIATAFNLRDAFSPGEKPSQDKTLRLIKRLGPQLAPGFEFGSVKGIAGEFYTKNRLQDIVAICREIILAREEGVGENEPCGGEKK